MQEAYWMELGGRCQKLLMSLCICDVHQSIGSLEYVVHSESAVCLWKCFKFRRAGSYWTNWRWFDAVDANADHDACITIHHLGHWKMMHSLHFRKLLSSVVPKWKLDDWIWWVEQEFCLQIISTSLKFQYIEQDTTTPFLETTWTKCDHNLGSCSWRQCDLTNPFPPTKQHLQHWSHLEWHLFSFLEGNYWDLIVIMFLLKIWRRFSGILRYFLSGDNYVFINVILQCNFYPACPTN